MSRFLDVLDKLRGALTSPSKTVDGPPKIDDFELLLVRLEREFTIAHSSAVWKSTWTDILALSQRLFADKGDLCEFYARDHAVDLVLSRGIEGVDEAFFKHAESGTIRTLGSLAEQYIQLSGEGHWLTATAFGYLLAVVKARSHPETSRVEVVTLTLEVLRRAGAPLPDDDCAVRTLEAFRYEERRERYERQKGSARSPSKALKPGTGG